MSQFTFSIRGKLDIVPDHTMELADASTAAVEAARYAGVALGLKPAALVEDDEWVVDCKDATGLLLVTITLSLMRSPAMQRH